MGSAGSQAAGARTAIVVGGSGRMGTFVREALLTRGFEVAGSYDVANIDELDEAAPAAELVVDFSAPAALPHVAAYVVRTGAALVSGVTGLGADDLATLRALGEKSRVIWASNYSLGVAALRRATALVAEALGGCAALLSPVAPTPAYRLCEKTGDPMEMYLGDIYTVPANITGLPAVSVPCGRSAEGLPIGMSLMGARDSLPLLMGIAGAYERAAKVNEGMHPYDAVEKEARA